MEDLRLAFDARMIRHTGIGTYIRGLLGAWKDLPREEMPVLFGDPNFCWQDAAGYEALRFKAPIYSLQEQALYPFLLKKCRLWHAPHYNIPFCKPARTRLVVTIHDLIHWIFRKQFFSPLQASYAQWMLRRVVESADHILTVSENTKRDLTEHFGADPAKMTVTYEAVAPFFQPLPFPAEASAVKQKYNLPGSYFLYVGSLKPHKNVLGLVRAFRKLHAERKIQAALVLAGRKDRRYPAGYRELAGLQDGEGLFYRPMISNADLAALYNGALALVHPSLYEGFGLTLLEAMACGTPVAAFRAASIPEVVGDAACLMDPADETVLTRTLIRLENDEAYRQALRSAGLKQVQKFSWQKTADQTMAVYKKILL